MMIKDVIIDGKDFYVEYHYDKKGTLIVDSLNRIANKGSKGYAIVEYEKK